MALDQRVEDVIGRLYELTDCVLPLEDNYAWAYLVKHEVLPARVDSMFGAYFISDRIHFVTILKNGGLHCILVVNDSRTGDFLVFDPDEKEMEIISQKDFDFDVLSVEMLRNCVNWVVE